ncbi:MAG: hypothetical protein NWR61_04335 [Pseudomonadales bacterium]|jgi:hypothetical protein|nr:hypothetical protein [Pseudomonadales bacterium]MDP4639540.1 hypothetical protein [Pseudomonadales bacterium]MDP4765560.1 hypothetical protein [Pseudomonadales bacterium]MDP4875207.1 hypothetical protein [Pseudomonadales bacterium]MDP4910978.1 hypothetical protein [Pseudomonadales bacterium]
MRRRFSRQTRTNDAFTDLLFNTLLGFAFMFLIAFILIAEPDKQGNVTVKAEFLITVAWPDGHPDDIDVLVEDPNGEILWFDNKDTGTMHLDRDDRGAVQDQMIINGELVTNPINQESITVRAWIPGEYVVNILHYKANYSEPVAVSVKVEKLNPVVTLVYYGVHQLSRAGMEVTASRFVLDSDGDVAATSDLQKRLLTKINPGKVP